MPDIILDYLDYIFYIFGYLVFCAIGSRFIDYFIELKDKTIISQKELRRKFESEYNHFILEL